LPKPELPRALPPNLLPVAELENPECPNEEEEALLNREPEEFEKPLFDPAPEPKECEFDAIAEPVPKPPDDRDAPDAPPAALPPRAPPNECHAPSAFVEFRAPPNEPPELRAAPDAPPPRAPPNECHWPSLAAPREAIARPPSLPKPRPLEPPPKRALEEGPALRLPLIPPR
jgi:hypothetical protein